MIITKEKLKEVSGADFYDGSLIHERFAYKVMQKNINLLGNIVSFRAPMVVTDNLIDLEDSLNNDYIYSDDAINFCIEIPDISLFAGVCFQRLFMGQLAYKLSPLLNKPITLDGDDVLVTVDDRQMKASVSIAAHKNDAVLIHAGINIEAGVRAPDFAFSTKMTDEQATQFMEDAEEGFAYLLADIKLATSKVIV